MIFENLKTAHGTQLRAGRWKVKLVIPLNMSTIIIKLFMDCSCFRICICNNKPNIVQVRTKDNCHFDKKILDLAINIEKIAEDSNFKIIGLYSPQSGCIS